jgi:VWFA-related protein
MARRAVRLVFLLIVLCGCGLAATLAARIQSAADKTIFVGVVDESGKPVKDIQMGEILIREDGADREVISIKPATEPLYIALLVDTTPGAEEFIRDIRDGFTAFVRQVGAAAPDAQMLLMEFGQAAVVITPFTNDIEALDKSINRLFPKPKAASVLLEALIAASNELAKRQSRRRAIVAFNMEPSNEQSREEPRKINDSLRMSGAQLWSVSLQKGANKNAQRDVVLGQLVKNTGGRREFIVAQSAVGTYLKMYGDALTSQYEVTYKRPVSGRPKVLQTGTTRGGVRLHSSLFPPE